MMFKYVFIAAIGFCCANVSFGAEAPVKSQVKKGVELGLTSNVRIPDHFQKRTRNPLWRNAIPLNKSESDNGKSPIFDSPEEREEFYKGLRKARNLK